MIAFAIAIGSAAIDLLAKTDCGVLGCFAPGAEGEMWQALSPWGSLQPAAADETNLQEGECSYSHFDDELDVARQCKIGGQLVPPPYGNMMYPFAIAADGPRVYVSDQFNHRIQAFDFAGTPIPLVHPIGDGVPGIGAYTDALGRTGQRLRAPEGVAVDATGKLLVADSYNGRVAIFNSNGTVAFGNEAAPINVHVDSIIDEVIDPVPTGIAITPDTTVLAPGTVAADDARIVVTDRDQCSVFIYDRGFNLLHQLPEVLPEDHSQGVCVYPSGGQFAPDGFFGSVTGVAIDADNHIYVADYDNSRVAILDKDGQWLGSFGQPPVNGVPGPESLQLPWGIMVTHSGRVVVTDSDNQRISFYSVDFTGGPPVSTYLFQLDAGGTLNGFPTGIAEQVSSNNGLDGLDPAGRILTTDTQHHRVQRFQLPDLAIVSAAASGGVGSFEVVVPSEKAADVLGTTATVVPVEGGVNVDLIAALPPADPSSNDIGPGQTVKYQFSYTSTAPIVHFKINASGNTGNTVAPEVIVEASAPCADCGATHVVNNYPIVLPVVAATAHNVAGATWYDQKVYARITATGTDNVTKIGWFVQGPAVADHGGMIHLTPIDGGTPYADIAFTRAGTSVLSYWPVTSDGLKGTRKDVPIRVDLVAPHVDFSDFTPPTGVDGTGALWNKGNVSASYVVVDEHSGTDTPNGSVSFINEGRNQSQTINAVDRVGHASSTSSSFAGAGGRAVNIDKVAPNLVAPADIEVNANTAGGATVPGWVATATDPKLNGGVGPLGSGVASINNPGTFVFPIGTTEWQFFATDAAGNESAHVTKKVKVNPAPSSISSANASVVYGQTLNVSATVTPAFVTGTVTFSFGSRTATGTIAAGIATASFPLVVDNVSTYTMTVSYPGGGGLAPSSTTSQITVKAATVNVAAQPKSKVYGEADALTYTNSALVGTDTLSGSLGRVAGENVGAYDIQIGTLTAGPNYTINFTPAKLTITPRPVTVTADPQTKAVFTADPVFTYQITVGSKLAGDSFSGALTRDPGETPGDYSILRGTLTLGSNYDLTYRGNILTINTVAVNVMANAMSKFYGNADPVLTFTWTGPVTANMFTGSLSRDPGESVANYNIHQGTLALPAGYVIFYHSNLFSIQRRPATVTVDNKTKFYGDPNPVLTATVAGVVNGDTLSYTMSTAATTTSVPGGYPIKVTVAPHPNYEVVGTNGELQIFRRPATVTALDAQKIVGQVDPPLSVTSDFLAADGITVWVSRAPGEAIGTYAITPVTSGAALVNYAVTIVNGTFTILSDNQPPVCTAARGGEVWPPNHKKFYAAPITGVTDPENNPITIVVTGIWQDEMVDSTGDGQFSPDGYGIGTSTAWIRAERNGYEDNAKGNGRLYEIVFTATDSKGASCTGSVLWTVPHDQGQGAGVIDDGIRYDSTAVIPGSRDKSQIFQKKP